MAIMLSHEQCHAHSVKTLEMLNRYQDYLDNIEVVADMGCGIGLDAAWWANLNRDDGTPRNIKVNAIDNNIDHLRLSNHQNIFYKQSDFSLSGLESNSQDFIWAHNSLQYSISPFVTLIHWWEILKTDGMLLITLPFNFNVNDNKGIININSKYTNGCYFNWTLGNLITILAACGFDCRNSYFKIDKVNNWVQAAVYKLQEKPNPYMNWYDMCDKKLLPISVENSIIKNGNFNDIDIVVEWIDRTQYILSN